MPITTLGDCPGCGSHAWRAWRAGPRFGYLRCAGCGLGRLDPPPGPQELRAVFDDGYFVGGGARGGYQDYDADAAAHRANARDRLARLPSDPGLLVDVGCASGYVLDEAVRRGWQAVGVELSTGPAARARARGHRVEESLDQVGDLTGRVDVISLFQLLEHVPDPAATVRAAAALLRPGGLVVCETWDSASLPSRLLGRRWPVLSPPSVVWVLDRRSATHLLLGAGLELIRWRRSSKLVSVALVVGQAAPSLPRPLRRVASAAERRWGHRFVRYGLGDLVLLHARRPLLPAARWRGPS